ncbi:MULTISPECIES: hypothetical protein [unclassified Pseudoxanthomonas]|jgi:hypothetical protein|uniref:hypothetical protein n=1 Tax=unclassified Pseudoxanthomonas TaxID=2645906 RepID=UPI003077CB5A
MTKAVSTRLPAGCRWVDLSQQNPPAVGMALERDGKPVLSVVPKRGGWLVMATPAGASQPMPKIVVRSIADGMRWASKWINARSRGLGDAASPQASHAHLRSPS